MKLSIKQILAASALAAMAATPALAFDPASGGTGNGSLVVTVFDQVRGVSVMQDLGLNYLDFQNSTVSRDGTASIDVTLDAGYSTSFNVDMSIFAGSNLADIEWTVFAADGQGTAAGTAVLVTANAALGAVPGTNSDVTAMYGTNAYANIIGQCAAQLMTSVCTGSLSPAAGVYTGGVTWGDNFQFMDVSGSGHLGDALGFYALGRTSNTAGNPLVSTQFANANGVATWTLAANGTLSWSAPGGNPPEVPLPAAVWLLLSGLGGLGVIGRRRKEVAAA